MDYICTKCGRRESTATRKAHCDCGGLWKLDFEPPKFDLAAVDRREWSLFRYRRFMALEGETWRKVTLGEGMTPIVPLDENVMLKMDYFMPTLSFKDRGAAVLIAHCASIGVDRVVQDSSGNAGNAVAAYCARAGIACEIFVPEGTSPKKIDMIRAHGATCTVVPGSRDHCAEVCREKVEREGVYYANHVYNPFFYEGTKTYLYEVYEQLGRLPRHLVIPVGNGTLFLGVMHALDELLAAGCIENPSREDEDPPAMTKDELDELRTLSHDGFGFLARDYDHRLYAYRNCPERDAVGWFDPRLSTDGGTVRVCGEFLFVSERDAAPTEIAPLLAR